MFVCFYIYEKKVKTVLLYLIPSLLVPLSYVLVLIFYEKKEFSFYNLMNFIFNDLLQGSVQTNFGWKGAFFQVLNTFRKFFQLHPDIYELIKKEWVYILPFVFCSVIIFFVIRLLLRGGVILEKENNLKLFIKIHVFIFITNYFFAFYNYGNVEFMVMLPLFNSVTNSY